MEEIITKKIAQELMKIEGETRGMAIKDDFEYVLQKKGKEGLAKLENEMNNLGYPIKHKEIKIMNFYPSGLEPIVMLVIKKVFNFDKGDFIKLGKFSAQLPWIIRLFVKYFGSLGLIVKNTPKMWRTYYTKGNLKIIDFDKDRGYLIARLEDFALHPIYCIGLEGYFLSIVSMVVKGPITCQETKCVHKGDDCHEFLVKWQVDKSKKLFNQKKEQAITKEVIEELMERKGETRGVSIKGDLEYILFKKGKEGLEKIENELERLGYFDIKHKKLESMKLYPIGYEALTLLVINKLFNFNRKEFIKMGEFNSKVSLVVRLFMKYFVSLKLMSKQAPKFWREYYSIGDLKIIELNNEEKYIIVRVENFNLHPFHCPTVEGYLMSIIKMILGKPVTCQETKCVHKGDDYHEFLIKW